MMKNGNTIEEIKPNQPMCHINWYEANAALIG